MTNAVLHQQKDSEIESSPVSYNSEILELFIKSLQRQRDPQILDVGPVCEENIMFFAQQLKRIYVCDMFLRLDRELRADRDPARVWVHLDYAPSTFDGIQLWDFCDHLDDTQVKRLGELCHTMLKPEAFLMITAFEEQTHALPLNAFVTQINYQINFRHQPHLKLPWLCRHNRALMSILPGFNHIKSFQYRNGLREFLFKKSQ